MNPTILFVEDDKDDEKFIREMLEQLAFSDFTFCKDVKTAFEYLALLPKDKLPPFGSRSTITCIGWVGFGKGLKK